MDIKAILMGLTFAFIWSSAFTSARIIVADAPPLASLALRFFVSGLIGVALARALGQSWRLTSEQWRATFIFGICQNALYLGLNFVAMQWVEAGFASIIASTMPLMVAFALWVVFRDRLPKLGILGLILGFAGVVIIMQARLTAGVDLTGTALCVLGAMALTVATLSMRGATSGGNVMMVVGLQMLVGAVALGIASAFTETLFFRPSFAWYTAFVYTTLVPGLLATWIWFTLVQRIGAIKAATFHFLNPFFGVVVAAFVLGETLSMRDIIGVAIIMVGILAVQLSKAQKPT
ncbi:MAG: DMT family transporter [Paracoccaceae bacterium]